MEADFSGYATKAGLKCSDGRTITAEAFKHMDGMTVPLVWQHAHDKPENVLGHGILEARPDGMYVQGFFNDTAQGENSRLLVQHGDVRALSIYANQLVEKSKSVLHGVIKEVSLVLSGANPGAVIDQVRLAHGGDPNDIEILEDEAIISMGLETELQHGDENDDIADEDDDEEEDSDLDELDSELDEVEAEVGSSDVEHAASDNNEEETLQQIYDSMTDKQQAVVHMMVGAAFESADVAHSDTDTDNEGNLSHQEGTDSMPNVFEQKNGKTAPEGITLSHSDVKEIVDNAKEVGSFKTAVESYALAHGIENIELMFPDAQLTGGMNMLQRRTEWVAQVMDAVKKSPFARIKSMGADITADEARARGYVRGNLKKEEIIKLLRRVTTPTTIYKKQKLDRDDIVDITEMDVVAWLKTEMRVMLEEEVASALLIGDGREPDDQDKIDEEKLRPIAWDNEVYSHPVTLAANHSADALVESVLRARKHYKGTGQPTFYTTDDVLTDMILVKDKMDRRLYKTEEELSAAMRVSNIVVVETMERAPDILGIMVNLSDYTLGADRGGAISMFEDFDIDYNQQKYLIETRISGALTKFKAAVVIKRATGTTVVPPTPTFNEATDTITIPNATGVAYYDVTDPTNNVLLPAGAKVITRTTDVEARPTAGYSFPHNTDNDWVYAYTA